MFKGPKEDMNKSFSKICENTTKKQKKKMKMAQDIKLEIESLKNTQTVIRLEMEILQIHTKPWR